VRAAYPPEPMVPVSPLHPVAPLSKPPLVTPLVGGGGSVGGVEPPPVRAGVESRRLGEPEPGLVARPVVAAALTAEDTWDGDAEGLPCRYSATAPATCGDAIEVPLMLLVALLEVCHAEVIELPGAKRSTQLPQLEKLERASELVVEPTVIAAAARAGETLQAFWFSLPAATTTGMPRATSRSTAWSRVVEAPPHRLMLTTDGRGALLATQSIPAMIPDVEPLPVQPRTRTGTRVAPLATP